MEVSKYAKLAKPYDYGASAGSWLIGLGWIVVIAGIIATFATIPQSHYSTYATTYGLDRTLEDEITVTMWISCLSFTVYGLVGGGLLVGIGSLINRVTRFAWAMMSPEQRMVGFQIVPDYKPASEAASPPAGGAETE